MNTKQYLLLFILSAILIACSTPQIIETSDPNLKLDQAQQLIESDAPLEAEKLLHQALMIYREKKNKRGEAEAYQRLGLYYSSEHYHDNADYYKQRKTYDAGNAKALNYLKKAESIFQKTGDFNAASITNYLVAMIYRAWDNKNATCGYLKRAINLNKGKLLKKPKQYMYFPNEYRDYEKFIRGDAVLGLDCD